MKLAAIYNVWDGVELLRGSMETMRCKVDVFIIVFQNISNFGEYYSPLTDIDLDGINQEVILKFYSPDTSLGGGINETNKRNIGIRAAREAGCTHFMLCDCDEYFQDFAGGVEQYLASGKEGSACKILTYFKKPTLRFENFDNYYVPFIHQLKEDTTSGHSRYPLYVDPTRRINCKDVAVIEEPMHHFSYIRKNILRKVRNSSAKHNIEKSQLIVDYNDPTCGPGFYVQDFNQKLIEVDNIFNIMTVQK